MVASPKRHGSSRKTLSLLEKTEPTPPVLLTETKPNSYQENKRLKCLSIGVRPGVFPIENIRNEKTKD